MERWSYVLQLPAIQTAEVGRFRDSHKTVCLASNAVAVEHSRLLRRKLDRLEVEWGNELACRSCQSVRRGLVLQGFWCTLTATLQVAAEHLGSSGESRVE